MSEEKRLEEQIKHLNLELSIIIRVQNDLIKKSNQNKNKLDRRFDKYEKKCKKTDGINNSAASELKKHISNLSKKANKKRFPRRFQLDETYIEGIIKMQRRNPEEFKSLTKNLVNALSSNDLYTSLAQLVSLQQSKRREFQNAKKELENAKKPKKEEKKEEKKIDNKPREVNLPKEPQHKPVRENSYTPAHEKPVSTVTNSRVQQTAPRKAEKISGRSLKKMSDLRFSQVIASLAQDYKNAEDALKNELLNVYRTSNKQDQYELEKITRERFQIYNTHREQFSKYISKLDQRKQDIYNESIKAVSNGKFSSFPTEQEIKYNINERIISNLPREQQYNAENQLRKDNQFKTDLTRESINHFTKYMTEDQMIRFYKTFCNNLNEGYGNYIRYSDISAEEKESMQTYNREDLVKLQEVFVIQILNRNNMKHTVENMKQILETKFNEELYPEIRSTYEAMNKQEPKETKAELDEMFNEVDQENSYTQDNGYYR